MANMPLTDIGITPRKASQFASKGIETVTDLLGYYPTKYLDFRNPISFAEGKYHQGEHVAIKGKVVSGRVIDGKHYMLRLTDGNTFCTVFWFNQPFRTRQFSVGDVIALGGVVSWNEQYNNMTMATPDFVTTDIASAFSIQPVYRKIKGMSVEYLEDAIKLAMPYTRECSTETLSLAQMRALRVPPIAEAIHMAHQPTDEKEIRLSRKRRAVDVLYPFCYELEAKKAEAAKVSFCRIKSTRDVLNKMQGVLPFKLTEDQKNAAEHMLTEMEHGERVDTLVQGDVGCGKTVVAEICALAMAMNGFQCAVMAPTVVLATQHYEEFSKILGSFGYKTVFLRSGMKAKEEKSVLEEIESGKAQIIVGTHSVISGKVKYHKLGLTIVDEEHRFGVEQREALKQKAKDGVHNVSMSATPIPRSLANTLYAVIGGGIDVKGDLMVAGKVMGHISASTVTCVGETSYIEGNVTCNKLRMHGGKIKGHVTVREKADINGEINGDIECLSEQTAAFGEHAVVAGTYIRCSMLKVEPGAQIAAKIEMKKPNALPASTGSSETRQRSIRIPNQTQAISS